MENSIMGGTEEGRAIAKEIAEYAKERVKEFPEVTLRPWTVRHEWKGRQWLALGALFELATHCSAKKTNRSASGGTIASRRHGSLAPHLSTRGPSSTRHSSGSMKPTRYPPWLATDAGGPTGCNDPMKDRA